MQVELIHNKFLFLYSLICYEGPTENRLGELGSLYKILLILLLLLLLLLYVDIIVSIIFEFLNIRTHNYPDYLKMEFLQPFRPHTKK